MTAPPPSTRIVAYALLALAAAVGTMSFSLSAGGVGGDEAIYAQCVDNMIATGDWLSPTPEPGTTYFQKPPLQMWLTAIAYHWWPDIVRYRIWSAGFGVLCVVLTCVLAGLLIGPEIGLIAALLLATNHRFLYDHGVRLGVFDAGLTFFLLAAMAIYAWLALGQRASGRVRCFAWVMLGIAAGLAGMLKPLAAMPLLLLLALHTLTMPRAVWRRQLLGLAAATGFSLLVMAPWFIAMTVRYGWDFPQAMLWRNIAERGMMGLDPRHFQSVTFYVHLIHAPWRPFALVWPAAAFAILASLFGQADRRPAWRLVAIVGVGWVALFTLSVSKTAQYVYPAFPALAICIAGLGDWCLRRAATVWRNPEFRERTIAIGYAAAALILLRHAAVLAIVAMKDARGYGPYEVYSSLAPAIEGKHVRFILSGFPDSEPALVPTDLFYLRRMPGGVRCDGGLELSALLAEGRPTLLFYSRLSPPPDLAALAGRIDERFSVDLLPYSVRLIDAGPVVQPPVTCSEPAFDGRLRLSASPRVSGPGFLEVRVRLATPPKSTIVCTVTVNGRTVSDNTGLVLNDTDGIFTANLGQDTVVIGGMSMDVWLRPLAGNQQIRGMFERASLAINPRDPRAMHAAPRKSR